MGKKPFFSVVMPIYNVGEYLEDSVNAVLGQTFNDIQLILVDDASPDNSGEICDRIKSQNRDADIEVIHLDENGGLSNARNCGIEKATGDYMLFLDPDDKIDLGLFEKLKERIEKTNCDVIVYGLVEEYYDKDGNIADKKEISFGKDAVFTNKKEIGKACIQLEKKTLYGYAWNKAFRSSIIKENKMRFENITLIEDIIFNIEFFDHIDSLCVLCITPYHYAKRMNTSLTTKFVSDYYELHRQRVQKVYEQCKQKGAHGEEEKTILADIYARYIFSAIQRNCDKRSGMSVLEQKKWIKEVFNEELFVELRPYMTTGKSLLGILNVFLSKRNVGACLTAGRFIYFVKEKMPLAFSRAKQSR